MGWKFGRCSLSISHQEYKSFYPIFIIFSYRMEKIWIIHEKNWRFSRNSFGIQKNLERLVEIHSLLKSTGCKLLCICLKEKKNTPIDEIEFEIIQRNIPMKYLLMTSEDETSRSICVICPIFS